MNISKSIEFFKRSKMSIPGGVNSPVRAFSTVSSNPPFIQKAQGPYIWDVDNNKYIDYVGSWGPMILGHAHDEVIKAIKNISTNGTSFGAPTENEFILAEMIVDRVPGCDMVRLVSSGTEATMSTLRLARGVKQKNKIIKFSGCYHGHSDSFLIDSGSGTLTHSVPSTPGVTEGTAKDTLIAEFNNINSVKTLFDRYSKEIAAVIIEPVNGNTGCIPPKNKFLCELRTLCTENKTILIFDEVITGFRLSRGGASEYYSVIPDLYAFGKIIGGGMPIGAYGGRRDIMEHISPSGLIYQAGTLSGNPISVISGITTLNNLTNNVYSELESSGKYYQLKMQEIIDSYNYDLFQQRVGSMYSLFFCKGPINNVNDVLSHDKEKFIKYFQGLINEGIYIAPSQYEISFISYTHTYSIIDETIDKIKKVLEKVM